MKLCHANCCIAVPRTTWRRSSKPLQDKDTHTLTKLSVDKWRTFASIRFWFWRKIFSTIEVIPSASWLLPVSEHWKKFGARQRPAKRQLSRKGMWYGSPWCATILSRANCQLSWVPHHFGQNTKSVLPNVRSKLNYLRYFWSDPKRHKQAERLAKPSFPLLSTMLSTNLVGWCTMTKR